jgi:hypothetical protein
MNDEGKLHTDLEELRSLPTVVVDGQNVAFTHGEPIARELKKNKYFSYEGLKIVIEELYHRGVAAKIVLPEFILRKKRREKDDPLGVIDYFRKYNIFVGVNGKWTEQHKKDDIFMLGLAFSTKSKIITRDKFRNELEELGDEEVALWGPWLEKNRVGFDFHGDAFVPKSLSLKYDDSVCINDWMKESGVMKFWEETDIMMANSGVNFGWSELN